MATVTPNLNLELPLGTENVSRQLINSNNTKIDTFAGDVQEKLDNIDTRIQEIIDDTAGAGDTDKVWSADKSAAEVTDLKAEIDEKADAICKTIDTPASVVTIEDGADDLPVNQIKIGIEPVQEGTGDPSPDNVRPITGWTGCNVQRTGKNLIPNNYSSRTINGVTFFVNNDGSISVSGTPTSNASFTMEFNVNADLGIVVLNGIDYATNIMWDTVKLFTVNNEIIATFTQTEDKDRIINLAQYPTVARMRVIFKRKTNDVEVSGTVYPMLRKQSESADWEPYIGTTYPITFPSTVYGGELTIHADGTGELVVDRVFINQDGTRGSNWEIFERYVKFRFGSNLKNKSAGAKIISNYYVAPGEATNNISIVNNGDIRLYNLQTISGASDLDGIKSYLAEHPLEICCELITATSYQLSAPQVRTLLGLNHIWADTGDIESITYPVDTATAFDNQTTTTHGMIAGSDSTVAIESHAVGDVFICNNKLYKATATIVVGESIIEGSNVVVTSVAELMLNRPDFVFNASVMKNHPVSVTLGNQSRAIVFATGANAERVALISLLGGSTQAYAWSIHASAQITATIDGSTVTLAYSGSGSCFIDILKLSGNVTATMA